MAIRTTDTNPTISTDRIKEILLIETEIDKHLLEHCVNGRSSYMINVSDKDVVNLIVARYQKAGWHVVIGYAGAHLYRLEFEDIDQIEPTKKIKAIKPK